MVLRSLLKSGLKCTDMGITRDSIRLLGLIDQLVLVLRNVHFNNSSLFLCTLKCENYGVNIGQTLDKTLRLKFIDTCYVLYMLYIASLSCQTKQ